MKHTLFILFFCCYITNGFADNNHEIDSLKKLLPTLHDSGKVDCLNELSETYIGLPSWFADQAGKAQIDSAEMLISEALEEAKKINYIHGIGTALSLKAEVAYEKYDDYPQEEKYCREAIYYYKKSTNKKGSYKTYWRLGQALYSLSSFDDALNSLDTSYNLSKKAGDSFYVLCSVVVSCNVSTDKGDYAKAFEKLLILHQLITSNSDPQWKLWEMEMLGDLYLAIEDYNAAINYQRQGFHDNETLAKEFALNKQFDSAKKYFNLDVPDTSTQRNLRFYLAFAGEYYSLLNNYNEALPNLLRSLSYNKQRKDVNQTMRVLIDIAQTYFALQEHDSAFMYAREALSVARKTGAKQVIRDASKIISSVYDHWHRFDSAYFYYKQYTAINDLLVNNKVNGKLAAYGFEQKIELLNKEKEIQHVQLQKQVLQKYILIAGVAIFLFIAFLLWRNNRHKQKANLLLQKEKQKVEVTLSELKSTQAQLIQSEKMASLGELTAGIAHEIQNPLNFVNNFSDVNRELIAELKEEADKGNINEVKIIADNINENEEKIVHHGKRADAIVKGMLQHSRASTGKKEPTDINALIDEYLRLSYHGMRAKDKSFNATLQTDFDSTIGKINIVPQDIGRVLLNLFNNAFYALQQKQNLTGLQDLSGLNNYEPTVSVCTKKADGKVEIRVKDNGNGIPQKVVDKIFQPFFTTKPTGQGTGLGLSLSYDITKAHGGEIKVKSKEGEGSEFIIHING